MQLDAKNRYESSGGSMPNEKKLKACISVGMDQGLNSPSL